MSTKNYENIHEQMNKILKDCPKIGEIYKHYKSENGFYRIEGICCLENSGETIEPMIIYRHISKPSPIAWARPLKEWNDLITFQGKTFARYMKIDQEKLN
jgi:hypothetical protein